MKPDTWCTHEIRGFSLKLKQVQARISKEHCFVWVKYGEVFRDATYAEAAAMRKTEAKPDPMPIGLGRSGEVDGCVFKAPAGAQTIARESRRFARAGGMLFAASIHLQESANQSAILLINNKFNEVTPQFFLAHA